MHHWFDDLARGLARDKPSRRAMLRSTLRASLAAAGAAVFGRFGSAAELLLTEPTSQGRSGPCSIRVEGRTQIISLSSRSTFKGRSLTLEQTTRVLPKVSTTTNKIIRLGGTTLLEVQSIQRGKSTQVTVNYGPAFQGIKRATLSSADGKMLQGRIDNRRILPFRVGADPSSVKFADRNPVPDLKVDNDTSEAIKSILAKASQDASACFPKRPGRSHHAHSNHSSALPLIQGEPGHGSYPASSAGCFACVGTCAANGAVCAGSGVAGCAGALFFYGLCVAAVLASCITTWDVVCIALCYDTGEPCCPVGCGGFCCESDETCLDPQKGTCCSAGLVGCGAKRCCPPTDNCINATGECCPPGQIICNNVCCKPGDVCNGGITCCPPTNVVCAGVCCGPGQVCLNNKRCCPADLMCGNICCDELTKCADSGKGICCSFAVEVCNGICCKPGEKCLDGKCCVNPCGDQCCGPNRLCCGGVCCALGETCMDPTTKTCKPCENKRQVGCMPQKLGSTPGTVKGICCPPNVMCCNDQCCKPGEICCGAGAGGYGCHPIGECVK